MTQTKPQFSLLAPLPFSPISAAISSSPTPSTTHLDQNSTPSSLLIQNNLLDPPRLLQEFGSPDRGFPTLKWAHRNRQSKNKNNSKKKHDDTTEGLGSLMFEGSDDNYRVNLGPVSKYKKGTLSDGTVSIISADTHITLSPAKSRPPTQSAITYSSSSTDSIIRPSRPPPLNSSSASAASTATSASNLKETLSEQREIATEKWLKTHNHFPHHRWTVAQRRSLKKWFDTLDNDSSGEIDIHELSDPLLSTGIAKNMMEVEEIVKSVDRDGSGEIGFEEFLKVMQPKVEEVDVRSKTKMRVLPKIRTKYSRDKKKHQGNNSKRNEHDDNPIARLQQLQSESGNVSLQVLIQMQRRAFLMTAIVDSTITQDLSTESISKSEAEVRHLHGKDKFKLMSDIKNRVNDVNKKMGDKDLFLGAMRKIIEKKNHDMEDEEIKLKGGTKRNVGKVLPQSQTLTEAIDDFGVQFEIQSLKDRRAPSHLLPIAKQNLSVLRQVVSRGSKEPVGDDSGWYIQSKLKANIYEDGNCDGDDSILGRKLKARNRFGAKKTRE